MLANDFDSDEPMNLELNELSLLSICEARTIFFSKYVSLRCVFSSIVC